MFDDSCMSILLWLFVSLALLQYSPLSLRLFEFLDNEERIDGEQPMFRFPTCCFFACALSTNVRSHSTHSENTHTLDRAQKLFQWVVFLRFYHKTKFNISCKFLCCKRVAAAAKSNLIYFSLLLSLFVLFVRSGKPDQYGALSPPSREKQQHNWKSFISIFMYLDHHSGSGRGGEGRGEHVCIFHSFPFTFRAQHRTANNTLIKSHSFRRACKHSRSMISHWILSEGGEGGQTHWEFPLGSSSPVARSSQFTRQSLFFSIARCSTSSDVILFISSLLCTVARLLVEAWEHFYIKRYWKL